VIVQLKGCDFEVEVEIDSFSPAVPAVIHKLPEDCSPADPGEIEWHINTGNELLDHLITNNFEEEIHEQIIINMHEPK